MNDGLPPLPDPYDYCYEWDGPYGKRKFSTASHNGRNCDRSVPLYTAEQMHAHSAAVAAVLAAQGAPIGFLAAYELDRLRSGHDARLRSPLAGPSQLDCDVPVYAAPAAPRDDEASDAYDKIDRFLRNNLDDADYAEYSAALDVVWSAAPAPVAAPRDDAVEAALKATWKMVDPLRPPGAPGSYARGSHNGICDALKTFRDNYERELRARPAAPLPGELYEAAKAFYNATIGDPRVEVSSDTAERRDTVTAAGDRLRAVLLEMKSALSAAQPAQPALAATEGAPAAAPLPGELPDRDTARLDFLDRCHAALNAHYGTPFGWNLIINHNVVRLLAGQPHRDIDLHDSEGSSAKLSSCRAAIDAAIARAALSAHQPEAKHEG